MLSNRASQAWGWLQAKEPLAMLQARVEEADIKLQGVGLKNLLEKYFVAPELRLLPADYWTGYRGFKMILVVRNFVTWHMRLQVVTTLIGYSPLCENAQQGDVSSLNVGPHLKRKRLDLALQTPSRFKRIAAS